MSSKRWKLTGSVLSSRVAQWTQRGLIRSVQRGVITILGAATSQTATITAVDLSNTVLVYLGCNCDTNNVLPTVGNASLVFTNATTLTITRLTAGASTVTVGYEVIEYWPGVWKSIQRGTVVCNTTATITAVDVAKSSLAYLGATLNNAVVNTNQTDLNPYVTLTNATTITGSISSQATASWQVTEGF